jgi:hypothetical protein
MSEAEVTQQQSGITLDDLIVGYPPEFRKHPIYIDTNGATEFVSIEQVYRLTLDQREVLVLVPAREVFSEPQDMKGTPERGSQ